MAKISTKELFDEYFSHRTENERNKIQSQVDRPEVYEYENEIQKQLIDMDVDELYGLILTFGNRKGLSAQGKSKKVMSYSSYMQIFAVYRAIWNYYIDNYEIIKNPWNDKRLKGQAVIEKIYASVKQRFTTQDLEAVIDMIYKKYKTNEDKAKYVECLIRLFYDGVSKADEIVTLKESMINFNRHEIRLLGRTVTLSDKSFSLLNYVHHMTIMRNEKGDYVMLPWNDGYFKFIVRPSKQEEFPEQTVEQLSFILNKKIVENTRDYPNRTSDINYKFIFYLGVYDKLCDRFGEEHANVLINTARDPITTRELMDAVNSMGYSFDRSASLKANLRIYT